jgi:hypothetical protein
MGGQVEPSNLPYTEMMAVTGTTFILGGKRY